MTSKVTVKGTGLGLARLYKECAEMWTDLIFAIFWTYEIVLDLALFGQF